jgi:hypothetical protein
VILQYLRGDDPRMFILSAAEIRLVMHEALVYGLAEFARSLAPRPDEPEIACAQALVRSELRSFASTVALAGHRETAAAIAEFCAGGVLDNLVSGYKRSIAVPDRADVRQTREEWQSAASGPLLTALIKAALAFWRDGQRRSSPSPAAP